MNDTFFYLRNEIARQKKLVNDTVLLVTRGSGEIGVNEKLDSLVLEIKKSNDKILEEISRINLTRSLVQKETKTERKIPITKIEKFENLDFDRLEKDTLKRLKKKEGKIFKKKEERPSAYVNTANRLFSKVSWKLIDKEIFRDLKRDLIRGNVEILPASYISVLILTTMISIGAGFLAFLFFLFFDLAPTLPFIVPVQGEFGIRFLKTFWILFAVPIATFGFMYFYPAMERKSAENKINQELPFATIHMSAISGSMIDPTKIFSILISTEEYPYLEKEFTKLLNEINVYGFDLVSALRDSAFNSPSKKLSELFNGLATTITSGGNLQEFFDKRAQSLLFEYRLEREKSTRSAETFMDIYISLVIAAPMILMLLLMMIKISGLGISLSTGMITLIMILGVAMMNIVFLVFLTLRQPTN